MVFTDIYHKNMYGKDCIHLESDIEANYDMCRMCQFFQKGCLGENAHVFYRLGSFCFSMPF